MTRDDWAEAVTWLNARYSDKQWTEKIIGTYFDDLKRFDAADVWTAIHMYHEEGNTYTPLPGQLIRLARDSAKQRVQQQPALPAPHKDTISWAEYSTSAYGEVIPFTEAIERTHLAAGPCRIRNCTIHNKDQPAEKRPVTLSAPW